MAAFAGIALLCAGEGVRAAPDARTIMDKVAMSRKLDGSSATVKMTTYDAAGKELSARTLNMWTKLYTDGTADVEKRLYRFTEPADVKGTGVLVWDYAAKPDELWIFMSALRTTRRVLGGDRSKSFMGSEFSYGDLNIPPLDDFTYSVLKEEQAGGEACYAVEVKPKSDKIAKDEGYKRKIYWVSKATNAVRKGQYFDLDGKLLKELTTSNIKELDAAKKRFRAMKMEMKNVNGRRSVFETLSVGTAIPTDDHFTTTYLETN